MAKQIKLGKGREFNFAQPKAGGAESKYPWDEWFDGSLLLLERSEGEDNDKGTIEHPTVKKDYEVSTNAMVPKLVTAARRKYKVVQVSRMDADGKRLQNALIIKARDMTPEERVEEDALRIEEKQRFAERRAAKKAEAVTNGRHPDDAPTASV